MPTFLIPAVLFALFCVNPSAFAAEAPQPAAEISQDIDPKDLNTGGAGDLLVAPTRVVLEGHKRSAEIVLRNTGTKEATYRVKLIHLHMGENGHYKEIKKEELEKYGEKSADAMLRYSPRQVTLAPGQTQTVKVMARKLENMESGEYRSHLAFHATPDAAAADVEAPPAEPGQISIRLVPVYGVSIPVIVRQGQLDAEAGISDFRTSGRKAILTLTRSGNKSLFGDVLITSGGTVIGQMRGVAVLLPNIRRQVTIEFDREATGPLIAEYRARSEEGGGVLAKAER